MGALGRFTLWTTAKLLFHQARLDGRTGAQHTREMLDALLPRVGSLGGGDTVRNVADERDMLLLSGVGDREVSRATEDRLNLDEVDALRDQRLNIVCGLRRVGHYKRR